MKSGGISRSPMEGRCGSEFLKRTNKKTIWKVNQESAGPEVAAGGWAFVRSPTACMPDYSRCVQVNQQYSHLVPGKSTFLLRGSTGPHFKGYPTSRVSPWGKPALVRSRGSDPAPLVSFHSAPAASPPPVVHSTGLMGLRLSSHLK